MGRLRVELRTLADVTATKRGFALAPRRACEIVVLTPPVEDEHAAVLALLADGEAWSSSALALALGAGVRTVQRVLRQLALDDKAQSFGRGRACRSEEHTSELQSLMRISYAVFCLKKKTNQLQHTTHPNVH